MEMKLEVVQVPVSDVDRARDFYSEQLGFNVDVDRVVPGGMRVVQLTPPGSACSIVIGEGLTDMVPGTQRGIMMVIEDADAARAELLAKGVGASDVDVQPWGRFVYFPDPDGNTWALQQLPEWSAAAATAPDSQTA